MAFGKIGNASVVFGNMILTAPFGGLMARWVTGTPDEARDTVRKYAEAGVERIMLQDFLPWDLDMIDVMGEALVGKV